MLPSDSNLELEVEITWSCYTICCVLVLIQTFNVFIDLLSFPSLFFSKFPPFAFYHDYQTCFFLCILELFALRVTFWWEFCLPHRFLYPATWAAWRRLRGCACYLLGICVFQSPGPFTDSLGSWTGFTCVLVFVHAFKWLTDKDSMIPYTKT